MKAGAWKIRHVTETVSTNLDARTGVSWDVFTADFQTAGRGRLDHRWFSPPGVNLMMSVVLPVGGLSPARVSTLPLVIGLAVVRAVRSLLGGQTPIVQAMLKWPNDVLIDGRKVCGILCERVDDRVIAGIGINVGKQSFPPEIAACACTLANYVTQGGPVPTVAPTVAKVRDCVLNELATLLGCWFSEGFEALWPEISSADALRGETLAVRQTDRDASPLEGVCGGIRRDGSLEVDGMPVYAGEAHIIPPKRNIP